MTLSISNLSRAVGSSGYSGVSGFSGFSGQNGVIGVNGDSGYSGFSGVSGFSGFSGISGYSGFSGVGVSGYSGFSGQTGPSNTINAAGANDSLGSLYLVMVGSVGSNATARANTSLVYDSNTQVLQATVLTAKLQAYSETVTTVGTVTSNTNVNTAVSNIFDITLGANNIVFTFVGTPASGISKPVTIVLRQDATGNRFATFANAKYTDATAPVLSTGASARDVLTFFTIDGGTNWFGSFAMANVG